MLSGFGSIVAPSITTAGAVTAGSVAATTMTASTSINVASSAVVLNTTGVDMSSGTGLVVATQLNVVKVYWSESTAPSALANFGIMYATDVAGKTRISVKAGNAGTTADLVTEA